MHQAQSTECLLCIGILSDYQEFLAFTNKKYSLQNLVEEELLTFCSKI